MANSIINFIKKTYKILTVILAAIIFFLGYNMYLVDRSLANLRITLDKVADVKTLEDAKRLATALDYSLFKEIASPELQASNLSRIELARDILSEPQDISQLEDVKFTLREVIKLKESQRSPILVALDRINQVFAPAITKISKAKLKDEARYLEERMRTLKDKDTLQEAAYELSNIYTQLSEFAKAKETYLEAIDLNPESDLAQKARLNLAWNEKRQGNFDEAIKELEDLSQAVGREELAIFSKYQLADTYRKRGDYEKTIAIYQEIAERYPGKDLAGVAKFQAGSTYLYDLKDYEKAKEVFEETKTIFKDTVLSKHIEETTLPNIVMQYCKEGFRLLQEGYERSLPQRYKEALKKFDKALEINRQHGISYTGKALAFLWLKDPDKALGFARQAVKILPKDEIASVNLGYIYIELDLVEEAIIEFKRFISVNPFTSRGYYNLGYAYALGNRLEEAAEAFRKATQIDPKFVFAFNNQGWCLWRLGRYAEATEAFKNAIQIKPDFLDAIFNLGMVYKILGRYEEAKKNFQSVLKINPIYPEAQTHLKEVENIIQRKTN